MVSTPGQHPNNKQRWQIGISYHWFCMLKKRQEKWKVFCKTWAPQAKHQNLQTQHWQRGKKNLDVWEAVSLRSQERKLRFLHCLSLKAFQEYLFIVNKQHSCCSCVVQEADVFTQGRIFDSKDMVRFRGKWYLFSWPSILSAGDHMLFSHMGVFLKGRRGLATSKLPFSPSFPQEWFGITAVGLGLAVLCKCRRDMFCTDYLDKS